MSNILPTIKDRVLQLADLKEDSKQVFFKKTGLNYSNFTGKSKDSDLGSKYIAEILLIYPDVNIEWLITGCGPIIKSEIESKELPALEKENHLIPLYDTIATAGKSSVDMAPVLLPSEYIDAGDWFRDATAAMRVHGDSMYPEYHSGSIVAIKEVSKGLIVYGEDYVFETDDYRMLKRLQRGQDREHVLVASANTEKWDDGSERGRLVHEPFDVHLDEIKRLFIVLGSVRRVHTSRIVYNTKNGR